MSQSYKKIILETINKSNISNTEDFIGTMNLERKIKRLSESEARVLAKIILEQDDFTPTRKSVITTLGVLNSPVGYVLYRTIRSSFDKCSAACGSYALNTPKRQICMAKCNYIKDRNMYQAAIKNKESQERLAKLKIKFIKSENRYRQYSQYAKRIGRNPDPKVAAGEYHPFIIPAGS